MVIGFERFMTSQTAQKSSNGAVAKERPGAKTRLSRRTPMEVEWTFEMRGPREQPPASLRELGKSRRGRGNNSLTLERLGKLRKQWQNVVVPRGLGCVFVGVWEDSEIASAADGERERHFGEGAAHYCFLDVVAVDSAYRSSNQRPGTAIAPHRTAPHRDCPSESQILDPYFSFVPSTTTSTSHSHSPVVVLLITHHPSPNLPSAASPFTNLSFVLPADRSLWILESRACYSSTPPSEIASSDPDLALYASMRMPSTSTTSGTF
ncbi:hypothetical protein NA56DRAFT_701242 [Hyaloscypha hepaticicola]|uniref:Uncharacterized protein n=1 Tax=Hyaloscypha hepaticicola TaxID=2082293 RepID=A0A2J6QC76_9HELO|nr:hypothetical protein NA56DRAFT_701242 [Hyaloscypha hepaticicola]